ncbi:DUF3794 domain-containing protein [Oscillospiraceae bacterium CM]|nr:DUF3794 domain-containing protein [Oscillospiraceae bacterium CM]
MDIFLNKEKINYVKSVLNASMANEETMEMIVPDALPDILRIVDTDGTVFLRSKSTDNGRAVICGVVDATVLYCPEGESGLRKLNTEVPFTVTAPNGDISPNTRVTANAVLSSADASMVNPRKIIVRVNLMTDVSCFNDDDAMIAAGLEDNGEAGIEALTDSGDIVTTTGVREKTFVISDELAVPAGNPPVGEMLKYRIMLSPEETKMVGSKLILRGSAAVMLLYLPEGGGEPAKADFSTEFSQIMELDNAGQDDDFHIILMPTNAYFDSEMSPHNPDGRNLIMEIHAVAQCVTSEKKRLSYIKDLYSTKYPLDMTTTDAQFENRSQTKVPAVFHGVLETPSAVSRVLALNVHPGAVTLAAGSGEMSCPLNVCVLYISDDGRVLSAMRQFDVTAASEPMENAHSTANAVCGKDVYGVPVGNAIELRIPVDMTITATTAVPFKTIDALSYDETMPLDRSKEPSLIVTRTANGESLWDIAKKHHSSSKLILAANEMDSEENMGAGQLLIIPKQR